MIAWLTGTLLQKTPAYLIVEVHGIGYQIAVSLPTFYRMPEINETVTLHVHTHVREDALQLYGFLQPLDKEIFLLLTTISGIGPKLALGILSGMESGELIAALRNKQVDRLKAIPGIGSKTAGRMILELQEKIAAFGEGKPQMGREEPLIEDALSALVNLGYSRAEAKRVIDDVGRSQEGQAPLLADLIKEALKRLAKVHSG
jgi:Holliday junction DNA helicase RuvA